MRGRNIRCRLEMPIDTQTATGGRTRTWPDLPEFGGALTPLSSTEQELWDRKVDRAAYKLGIMARAIPDRHRDKVIPANRVVILNNRESIPEESYDIIGVDPIRKAGRIRRYDIILGKLR